MNLRFVFTLLIASAVVLPGNASAQTGVDDGIRVRVRDRSVIHLVTTSRAVAEQATTEDPCRDHGRDNDYYTFCEVREEMLPAGPLTVDAGRNGGIRVEGWDRNEIRVQAVVNAHARSESDAKQLASGVQIQAGGGKVTSTGPETGRREWWSVSFRINVPRKNDLDLTAHNGGVTIAGVSGNITFETSNGGVRLTDLGGDVRGQTRNGGLNVTLGGSRWDGAGLDVETTNGGVNGISTTLGSGGPPVRVRTTNGGLKINKR
jgi:hypothetical protein